MPVGVQKIPFSFKRHLLPPIIGIVATFLMYGLLNLPSYEAQLHYYVSRLSSPPVTAGTNGVIVDKKLSEIIIPSINVRAPVTYEPSVNNTNIAYDLRSGVVHYGTTALPGQKGNVVIFGHSSGVAWAPGNYKYIFTLIDKLQFGQQVSLDYKGTRFVYVVTDSKVVAPNDMRVLDSNGTRSQLSLITCTPVGTSRYRLVVSARQVRPDPANNTSFTPAASAFLKELPSNQ